MCVYIKRQLSLLHLPTPSPVVSGRGTANRSYGTKGLQ